MPLFMDRHDVSKTVTAENVAQLHQQDLKIQHLFGCRGLTYWFDDKRKTAFCLIEAPDMKSLEEMHNQAHGQVPHSIIEVEPSIVESFLGRIEDPEKAQNTELNIINDPAFRTIMVISLNRILPERSGASASRTSFSPLGDAIKKTLNVYHGNPVKQSEDYFLVSFKSVSNAIHAALDIKNRYKESRTEVGNRKTLIKIALAAGVPVTQKPRIFEETIKLAERMCEMVKGDIVIAAEVKDLYESENGNAFPKDENIFSLTPADEKFLTHLMDYTDSAWNDTNFKVDDFSKPMGRSKSQLYRKLILLTGKSPNTFIKEYRLKEALKLLKKSSSNISEVAFETGFTSPSYFSKCFQKRYGYLPSDYQLAEAD